MLNEKVNFFMEPALFADNAVFLSGNKSDIIGYPSIANKDEALSLLFDQDVPEGYFIWSDFFSSKISDLLLHEDYRESQDEIRKNLLVNNNERVKDSIRKRKAFLVKKKNGLVENENYEGFIKDVSDESIYMLNMVATQRYIYGEIKESFLEQVFSIYKHGVMPCGILKEKEKIVVFNPISLRE
ncbi:hypothetical protein [Kalamiella sp. sgz302252]|uniref:hypothetical protein n=1 Tax=Pantoea sp. sgz302252 TaxID=3341827 RepID=UPI0036D3C973